MSKVSGEGGKMDIVALLGEKRQVIEAALLRYLPDDEHILTQAMRYSLFAGGKRLRPILALLSYEAVGGGDIDIVLPVACALELVHTFTLIHDDLPAMDDDDFRRGKLSNHKKFSEGMAILAGDALMIDGLGLVIRSKANPVLLNKTIAGFTRVLGLSGVSKGQVDDLYGRDKNAKFLRHIHLRKTALYIAFSIWVGALLAGGNDDTLVHLFKAGVCAGMGFQIRDDVLDLISSKEELGKTPGKDNNDDKLTYPALYGLERSKKMANSYINRAKRIFKGLGASWLPLIELTNYLVERVK